MANALGNEKQHAHELIEQLPPHQLSAVVGLLEAMIDLVARKLAAAPIDDEPETEEERRAVHAEIQSDPHPARLEGNRPCQGKHWCRVSSYFVR